jgi:hypothetical protein
MRAGQVQAEDMKGCAEFVFETSRERSIRRLLPELDDERIGQCIAGLEDGSFD